MEIEIVCFSHFRDGLRDSVKKTGRSARTERSAASDWRGVGVAVSGRPTLAGTQHTEADRQAVRRRKESRPKV